MAAVNKIIQYGLEDRVLALSGEGKTTAVIAKIISDELAEDSISQPTVSRYLKAVRQERSEQTREIFSEHIKVTLPQDLKALEEIEGFMLSIFRNSKTIDPDTQEEKPGKYELPQRIDAAMKAVKVIETKLRYSGVLEGSGKGGENADPVDLTKFKNDLEDLKDEVANK